MGKGVRRGKSHIDFGVTQSLDQWRDGEIRDSARVCQLVGSSNPHLRSGAVQAVYDQADDLPHLDHHIIVPSPQFLLQNAAKILGRR